MKTLACIVCALCAVVSSAARGGVFTAAYLPQSAINGASSRYDCVVSITNFRSDGQIVGASGVYVISPTGQTGIVGSAHGTWGYNSLEIRTGANVLSSPTSVTSYNGAVAFEPRYVNTDPAGRRWDLAVIPITLPGITPVPYLAEAPVIGSLFEIVDFGVPTIVGGPHGTFDGVRRMGHNYFEQNGSALNWIPDMMLSWMDPTFAGGLLSETISSPGGSGGGTFVDIGGQLYLAGTQVNTTLPGFNYNSRVGAMNIGNLDTFISGVLVPSPGSFTLMTITALVSARRRSKAA